MNTPHDSHDPLVEPLQQLLRSSESPSPAETDHAWTALAARLNASPVRALSSAPSSRSRELQRRKYSSWRLAVSATAAMLVIAFGLQAYRTRDRVLEAPLGQRISATLPDGSTIMLAAGSRAQWAHSYGESHRTIMLTGEAWFDVVHDEERPFQVRAGHVVVEDIGTRFVVSAWRAPKYVDVAVEEGIVSIADTGRVNSEASQFTAGQRIRAVPGQPLAVSAGVEQLLAWTDGALQFDDALLVDAVAEIERWYNVNVQVDSALATRRFTARFETQPLAQLLDALSAALGVRVVRNNDTIQLVPQ